MRHRPRKYSGPVRGSKAWWRGLGQPPFADTPAPGPESQPAIRHDLVAHIRRQIAAGTYDTEQRWHAALDRFLDDLEQ